MLEPGILEPCLVVEHLPPYVGIVNAISIPIHFRFRVKTKRHGEDDESMLFDNFVMVETYDLQRTKNEKRRIFLIPIRRKRLFRELKNGTFIRFRQFHKVLPPLNELEGFSKELLEMIKDKSCFVAGKNSSVIASLDRNHQKEDYRSKVKEIVNRGRTEVTVSSKVEMTPEAMHRSACIRLNGQDRILNFSYVAPTAACDDGEDDLSDGALSIPCLQQGDEAVIHNAHSTEGTSELYLICGRGRVEAVKDNVEACCHLKSGLHSLLEQMKRPISYSDIKFCWRFEVQLHQSLAISQVPQHLSADSLRALLWFAKSAGDGDASLTESPDDEFEVLDSVEASKAYNKGLIDEFISLPHHCRVTETLSREGPRFVLENWIRLSEELTAPPPPSSSTASSDSQSLDDLQTNIFPPECFTVASFSVRAANGVIYAADANGEFQCFVLNAHQYDPGEGTQKFLFKDEPWIDLRNQHLGIFLVRSPLCVSWINQSPIHGARDPGTINRVVPKAVLSFQRSRMVQIVHPAGDTVVSPFDFSDLEKIGLVRLQEITVLGKSFPLDDRYGNSCSILTVKLTRASDELEMPLPRESAVIEGMLRRDEEGPSPIIFLVLVGEEQMSLYPFMDIGRIYWIAFPVRRGLGDNAFHRRPSSEESESFPPVVRRLPHGISHPCHLPVKARVIDPRKPLISTVFQDVSELRLDDPSASFRLMVMAGYHNILGTVQRLDETGSSGVPELILKSCWTDRESAVTVRLDSSATKFQMCFPGGVRMALNQLVVISNVQLNHSDMTDTLEVNCTELSGMFLAPSSVLSPSANGSLADATPVSEVVPEDLPSSASCSVSTSTTILTSTALNSPPTSISQIGDVLGDASSDPLLQANRCFLFQGNVRKIRYITLAQYCSLCGRDFDAGMQKCSSAPCANTESGGVRAFAKFMFSDRSGTAEITGNTGTCVEFLSTKFLSGVLRRMIAEKVSRLFLSAELDEARALEANADGWGAERQRVMEQACLRSQEEVIILVRIRKDVIAKDGKLKCSVQEVKSRF